MHRSWLRAKACAVMPSKCSHLMAVDVSLRGRESREAGRNCWGRSHIGPHPSFLNFPVSVHRRALGRQPPGSLPASAALARSLARPPSCPRPEREAESPRRGSRRGSEGKGPAPSSLRGGYVAILDPRDKKIHARENWWAVLPVTRPLSDSSI